MKQKIFILALILFFGISTDAFSQSEYSFYQENQKESIFLDDFNDNANNWSLSNYKTIKNGYYELKAKLMLSVGAIPINVELNRDFEFETEAKRVGISYTHAPFGAQVFAVEGLGFMGIFGKDGEKFYINEKAIKTAEYFDYFNDKEYNKLTIRKHSDNIYYFINEKLIYQTTLEGLKNFSSNRRLISLSSGQSLTWQFNYLKVSYLNKNAPIIVVQNKKKEYPTVIKTETDNKPPEITIISPNISRGYNVVEANKEITIKGKVTDKSGIYEVLVNDKDAYVDAQGNFSIKVLLAVGNNSFNVSATDTKQNTVSKQFTIERKSRNQEALVNNETDNAGLQTAKYYALIIGVEEYKDQSINDLDQPVSDAQKLRKVLLDNYTFEPQDVKFLKNPSKSEITLSLEYYFDNITEEDNLLVFYAGHGYWDKKFEQGYWLAADADRGNRGTWLSNGTIKDYVRAIPAKHTLLITDACFGGGIFKSRAAFGDATVAINQLYELPSRKAMTSGALSEVPDKSVFIEYLVKRLEKNSKKYLSSEQLFASFKIAVINNSSSGQVPQFGEVKATGDEGGDFIFIRK